MADGLYQRIVTKASAIIDDPASASLEEQVRIILRNFIKSLTNEPEMVKAIMYSGRNVIFTNEAKNPKPTNQGIRMFDQLIAEGITQGMFRPEINNTSWMVISAMLGFVMCVIENQLYLLENFNQLADDFIEILIGGIKQ